MLVQCWVQQVDGGRGFDEEFVPVRDPAVACGFVDGEDPAVSDNGVKPAVCVWPEDLRVGVEEFGDVFAVPGVGDATGEPSSNGFRVNSELVCELVGGDCGVPLPFAACCSPSPITSLGTSAFRVIAGVRPPAVRSRPSESLWSVERPNGGVSAWEAVYA